jgi:DUF4097 and DUF4098 domain-containing protein YvlB
MKRAMIPLLIALAAATGVASAQQAVNESRPASATAVVEIDNVAGSVRVVGWNRNEVQVTGTLGRGVERLEFGGDPDRIRVRVVVPRNASNVGGSDLEIRVPSGGNPRISTVSANITATGLRGAIEARSVSGQMELTADRAPSLQARTVSGTIRLRGSSGSVEVESVSGNLESAVASGSTRARTASGNLNLRELTGSLEAATVSGTMSIEAARLERLSLSSVSGNMRFSGDVERRGNVQVNSHSGNLEMRLPARVGADFDISTFSGQVENAFGAAAERTSRYGPGRELRFTAGDGGARVVIRTFSGDVRLVRQ